MHTGLLPPNGRRPQRALVKNMGSIHAQRLFDGRWQPVCKGVCKKKLLAGSGRRACQRRHARTGAAESPVSDSVVGAGLPAMRRLVATNA